MQRRNHVLVLEKGRYIEETGRCKLFYKMVLIVVISTLLTCFLIWLY